MLSRPALPGENVVRMSVPPPGTVSFPRRRPGRTQIAQRDKMFGSLEKRGGKLNLTPGKAHRLGNKLGRLAYTPHQGWLGQHLAWGLGRGQDGPALVGGVCGTAGRSPMGNEKTQRLVIAGLTVFCMLMFTIRERFVGSCQRL